MAYKTHYPKGRRAATPYVKEELAPGAGFFLVDGKELARRMGRAYNRRDRWQRQVARRRPAVPRPPTEAERTLACLRYYAAELTAQLVPFRRTRPAGHEPLRGLLLDADTRPRLLTQISGLRSAVAHLRPLYHTHQRRVDGWRAEWATATPQRRHELLHHYLAPATQQALEELVRLSDEALADAATIARFLPDAFAATAGQWWYTAPLPHWEPPTQSAPTPA